MKKIFIIFALSVILVSCGTKNNKELGKEEKTNQEKNLIHTELKPITPEQKYGKLAKYIKQDLTPEQDKKLQEILKQRRELILKIKKDLIEANKQGKFEEKMIQVEKQREEMMNKILQYIKEEKKQDFIKSCEDGNKILRKILKR